MYNNNNTNKNFYSQNREKKTKRWKMSKLMFKCPPQHIHTKVKIIQAKSLKSKQNISYMYIQTVQKFLVTTKCKITSNSVLNFGVAYVNLFCILY